MTSTSDAKASYEPPKVRELGAVHVLTQFKYFGHGDGLWFHEIHVTKSS